MLVIGLRNLYRKIEIIKTCAYDYNAFSSRQEELKALAESIQYNLTQDYLNPSRDILVIVLGSYKTYFKRLQINVAEYLMEQGIRIYIPSAPEHNILRFDSMQAKRNIFWCDGAVTVSGIYHAKGNEAYMVYVVGLDNVAMDESNANLRNQLFVALTRSMGWVKLSGVGEYPLYEEMRQVINSGNTLTFDFKRPPAHGSSDEDLSSEEETPDMSEQAPILGRKEAVSQEKLGSFLSKMWPFKK